MTTPEPPLAPLLGSDELPPAPPPVFAEPAFPEPVVTPFPPPPEPPVPAVPPL